MKKKMLKLLIITMAVAGIMCVMAPSVFATPLNQIPKDEVVADVRTEAQFKAAIRDRNVTYIRVLANITLKKNDATYTINENKRKLTIDGSGANDTLRTYTLSENPGNAGIGCAQIAVRNSNVRFNQITVKNINLNGSQELGIIHISCDCKNRVNVLFDNVDYAGPALAVAYGALSSNSVTVKDSKIALNPRLSRCNRSSEAVAARFIFIEGNVEITKENSIDNDDYNEIFRLLYKNSQLVVKSGANLTVNNYADPSTHRAKSTAASEYSGLIGTSLTSCDTSSVVFEAGSYTYYSGYGPIAEDIGRCDSCLSQLYMVTLQDDATLEIETLSSGITKSYNRPYFHNSFFDAREFRLDTNSSLYYTFTGAMNKGEKLMSFNKLTVGEGARLYVAAPQNRQAETVVALEEANASVTINNPYHVIFYNGKETAPSYALKNDEKVRDQSISVAAKSIKLWDIGTLEGEVDIRPSDERWDIYDTNFNIWMGATVEDDPVLGPTVTSQDFAFAAILSRDNAKTGGTHILGTPRVELAPGSVLLSGKYPNVGPAPYPMKTLYNRNILEINGNDYPGGIVW
ncbi:MAG: hypothetical protein LBH39_04320 [Clostridiales Family XIII bacterium]|nr:hypothetical protein [Clostridiales Family XIII bacterium]